MLERTASLRKSDVIKCLRPDAKSQVTLEYESHQPVRVVTVAVSHEHDPDMAHGEIQTEIIEKTITPVIVLTGITFLGIEYFMNPIGRMIIVNA